MNTRKWTAWYASVQSRAGRLLSKKRCLWRILWNKRLTYGCSWSTLAEFAELNFIVYISTLWNSWLLALVLKTNKLVAFFRPFLSGKRSGSRRINDSNSLLSLYRSRSNSVLFVSNVLLLISEIIRQFSLQSIRKLKACMFPVSYPLTSPLILIF